MSHLPINPIRIQAGLHYRPHGPVRLAWPHADTPTGFLTEPHGNRVAVQRDVDGETHDHPHHRSLYFAYGDVNGTDNWSEEAGHGYTKHRSVDGLVSGSVYGRFSTTSDWTGSAGQPLLEQKATVTVWQGGVT